jgi:hypothetical protein
MTRPGRGSLDLRADIIYKWLLRLTALAAFAYVLLVLKGKVALGVYVLIGGMLGLPSVLNWQRAKREERPAGDEEED